MKKCGWGHFLFFFIIGSDNDDDDGGNSLELCEFKLQKNNFHIFPLFPSSYSLTHSLILYHGCQKKKEEELNERKQVVASHHHRRLKIYKPERGRKFPFTIFFLYSSFCFLPSAWNIVREVFFLCVCQSEEEGKMERERWRKKIDNATFLCCYFMPCFQLINFHYNEKIFAIPLDRHSAAGDDKSERSKLLHTGLSLMKNCNFEAG